MKQKKEVGINYMKSWEHDKMVREEGVLEGRQEGIIALIQICHELNVTKEDTLSKLLQKFEVEPEMAKEYMKKYW